MVVHEAAPIIFNEPISPRHYRLRLLCPPIAAQALPGQFLHIRLPETSVPLLRRPFSVEKIPDLANVDLIYDVVGIATERMAKLHPNDALDLLGPLGKTFTVHPTTQHAILIGGGVGIPPLLFLAEQLAKQGIATQAFLGGKTKEVILCQKEFEACHVPLHVATEDGSQGFKGLITALFEQMVLANEHLLKQRDRVQVFCCGPTPMMQRVSELVRASNLACQHSLEERMGCGIGVCIGCVANTEHGYKRTCCEGPVFDDRELIWT